MADNAPENYVHHTLGAAPTLKSCQVLCVQTYNCKGVDYGANGCQVWTRPGGIGAAVGLAGNTCMDYRPFLALGSGQDTACRGADVADSWPSYYTVYTAVPSLADCRSICMGTDGC